MSWIETSREHGGSRRLLLGSVVLGLFCGAMLISAASAAAVGSISGNVIDSATKDPVQGVEVCAYPFEEFSLDDCDFTDSSGDYTVADLEADEYVVEFWGEPVGYFLEFFDDKMFEDEADLVAVSDAAVTGIDAELDKEPPPPPPPPPPVVTPVLPPPPPPVVPKGKAKAKGKKCKKGFRPKKVKGKTRCVKVKKGKRKGQRRRG